MLRVACTIVFIHSARAQTEPGRIPCTNETYMQVCPKYNVSNKLVKWVLKEIGKEGETEAYGCCVSDFCGNEQDCMSELDVMGLSVRVFTALFILACVLLCCCLCCCCLLCYCCCCRKKKSRRPNRPDYGSDSDSGSESASGSSGGEVSANCPLSRKKAQGFCDALEKEYCRGQEGAVGDFLADEHIVGLSRALEKAEDKVRDSDNPRAAVRALRRKWGIE